MALATALVLSGCAAETPEEGNGGAASTGIVTVQNNEPQNPLIPAVTNEVGGGLVLQNIFAQLVYYNPDGSMELESAESIESEDNQNWTITLKEGLKFSDGTDVTSDSFINAWQYAASDPAFENQWWFANFAGYNDGGAEGTDVVEESLALEATDERTFTVELAAPQADFPVSLGYQVFSPLPESFYDDPEAFGEAPIGNGPYVLETWEHDAVITLLPNESYDGPRKAQNGGLDLVSYGTQEAAYADLLSDNLDVIAQVPPSALATYKDDLGDRAVDQAAAIWQGLTIPERLAHFADDEEGDLRRQAISYAIDREEITSVIFEGTRTPAVDFTAPVIDGWSDTLKGSEVTKADETKAKELWAEADAISPWSGSFDIAYNADGGHQPWVDAVANQIKNTLGIESAVPRLRHPPRGDQEPHPERGNAIGMAVRLPGRVQHPRCTLHHGRWLERWRLRERRVRRAGQQGRDRRVGGRGQRLLRTGAGGSVRRPPRAADVVLLRQRRLLDPG
jgi:oligopeptide transport system substrate-binding protein